MHDNSNSLNDDEKQRLLEIEAELRRDDPELAAAFAESRRPHSNPQVTRRVGRVAGLTVGALVGVVTLTVGLVLPAPAVGIVGFAVLVGALSRLFDVGPASITGRVRSLLGLQDESRSDSGQRDTGETDSGRSP